MTDKNISTVVNFDRIIEYSEGDEVRIKKQIDLFIQIIPEILNSMNASMANKDFENIRILAHSIKPQLKFFGISSGHDFAETIEHHCTTNDRLEQIQDMINGLRKICDKAIIELKQKY